MLVLLTVIVTVQGIHVGVSAPYEALSLVAGYCVVLDCLLKY